MQKHTVESCFQCFIFSHSFCFLFFFKSIYFNWRLITLQYYSCFPIHWHKLAMGVHVFLSWIPSHLPPHAIPLSHTRAAALRTLSHASNLDWRCVLHMIIYMFQCYSLKSSHLPLLPQSPRECSIHLCLFCCLTYHYHLPRAIITIFLNPIYIYVLVYCIGVFLSALLHSV